MENTILSEISSKVQKVKNRTWLKIFSISFAILSWIYVNLQSANTIERTISIPVNYVNESSDSRITKTVNHIKAKFSGSRKDFMFAKQRYANARIDLIGLKAGTYNLPINIINIFPGLRLVSQDPSIAKVEIESIITKKVNVTLNTIGTLEDGYIADLPIISPKEVLLSGNAIDIKQIDSCYVNLDISKIKNSISTNEKVILKFNHNPNSKNLLDNISIEPSSVHIDMTVKKAPIKPDAKKEELESFKEESRNQTINKNTSSTKLTEIQE